jgi:hypothetical protein
MSIETDKDLLDEQAAEIARLQSERDALQTAMELAKS